MKKIQYDTKKDVFSNWLNEYMVKKQSTYIWAQICYEWNTGDLLHVIFERNADNKNHIEWPVHIPGIPVTNIDFTNGSPALDDGKLWDYRSWHRDALRCHLKNNPRTEPASFWNWRLQTCPQGNATCDLDFLCRTVEKEYIGIEATEIYYVDRSSNVDQDVFEHFQRLFKLRKGNNRPGFNLRQLKAQKKFIEFFCGRMFMLFHQIFKDQQPYRLREDKCLLLEIDDENYKRIESIVRPTYAEHMSPANRSASLPEQKSMHGLKSAIHFVSLAKILDRFVD